MTAQITADSLAQNIGVATEAAKAGTTNGRSFNPLTMIKDSGVGTIAFKVGQVAYNAGIGSKVAGHAIGFWGYTNSGPWNYTVTQYVAANFWGATGAATMAANPLLGAAANLTVAAVATIGTYLIGKGITTLAAAA